MTEACYIGDQSECSTLQNSTLRVGLVLPENIRLGVINTLAYYGMELITAIKCSGVEVAVINKHSNLLRYIIMYGYLNFWSTGPSWLSVTNTLAYYGSELIEAFKETYRAGHRTENDNKENPLKDIHQRLFKNGEKWHLDNKQKISLWLMTCAFPGFNQHSEKIGNIEN